jgi:hypothetical protein
MLIPNNVNIHGRITGATTLHGYRLRAEFPADTAIAYLKHPLSSEIEGDKRVLTYSLEDLINYEDYWWLPLQEETEFVLSLNLLPPFPQLNPVDLSIACRPDIAEGTDTSVTTTVNIRAEEQIDNLFLTMNAPSFASPGVSIHISEFSGDNITEPRQSVTAPLKEYPFPQLSLKRGEGREYTVKTRILADVNSMTSLKCQQDILRTRLLVLSKSSPQDSPCAISVLDQNGSEIPVKWTEKSTILQGQAQVMYSPFSIHREETIQPKRQLLETAAV